MPAQKWIGITALAVLLGGALYAGLRRIDDASPAPPPPPPAPPPAIITANNAFGFRLYAELAKNTGDNNLFISPLSAEYALAMVANGAGGKTYTQMAQALAWHGMTQAEVNSGFHALTARLLSADPKVQIDMANSLWLNQASTFHDAFLHTNAQYFGAEMRTVDFAAPSTITAINDWVKSKTHGMIPNIITAGDVDAATQLALLNALYFKGKWTEPFKAADTKEAPFTLPGGTKKTVKMMQRAGSFNCYEDKTMQMVKLPYGDGKVTMSIILPRDGVSLGDAAKTVFDAQGWQTYQGRLQQRKGSISLPRFKADYTVNLPAALQALGMTDAFTRAADFSGISATPTYISNVRQKTALEVNEEGTKAAAATIVTTRMLAMHPTQPPFIMVVDHPFLLTIQSQDNALLFLGAIANPG